MLRVKVSERSLVLLLLGLGFLKIAIYILVRATNSGVFDLGDGSDANYYHAYAMGWLDVAVNYWPILLRELNELGLYNRRVFSVIMLVAPLTFIPWLLYQVVKVKESAYKKKIMLLIFLTVSLYPTLYFFSVDIYRDVAMLTLMLLAWWCLKNYFYTESTGFYNLILFLALSYFCYLFRSYLGFAMISAFVMYLIHAKMIRNGWFWTLAYLVLLVATYSLGLLNEVTEYRGVEGFSDGGSTLGLGLHNKSPLVFAGYYVLSFFTQVFGLYMVNPAALLLFVIESLPFILALRYIVRHRQFMTPFCHYLLTFFVIYTTIWVVGNDNLGTAVRLRLYGYIAVLACFFIVYQHKINYLFMSSEPEVHR